MSEHYLLPRLPLAKAIRFAALALMQINHVVTTIEVKNYLCRQGYDLDHADVIHWMATLAQKEGWESSFDGRLREYRRKAYPGYDLCCEALGFSSN